MHYLLLCYITKNDFDSFDDVILISILCDFLDKLSKQLINMSSLFKYASQCQVLK